ncbi:polyprenyl synthetase family protein [Paenibacillus sp. ACRRX]|uniref:polyprenyl synthetase family protein n=1 Tax=Paenibacillus sp. ACRRX TaxID=2918206 RepID=UPI001EF40E4E|nr:polyprenyl synthetase family protein [Paenibacillus sp. ACRRX]MCG7409935.1 polyprenyl synthetase family protein [Paenibacillus sp. ACRRX]
MEIELVRMKEELYALIDDFFTDSIRLYARRFLDDKLKEGTHFGLLTIFHYRMFGGEGELIYKAGAAMELFMLSYDIFDDVQDQDASHKSWMQIPQPLAINVAIGLLNLGHYALQSSSIDLERVRLVANLAHRHLLAAVNGQTIDLMNSVVDMESYMDMIEQKSASMLIMACTTGVLLATGEYNTTVETYAREMGFGAQLFNDYRNMIRWEHSSDIASGRRTLPILILLDELHKAEYLSEAQFNKLPEYISSEPFRSEIIRLFENADVEMYIDVLLRTHYFQCMEHFDFLSLPDSSRTLFINYFVNGLK